MSKLEELTEQESAHLCQPLAQFQTVQVALEANVVFAPPDIT